jgi:hypothetical protein
LTNIHHKLAIIFIHNYQIQATHSHTHIKMTLITTALLAASLAASMITALGINCRGSGLCPGNKGILAQAQGQLRGMDQSQTFTEGQHITCVESSVSIGDPSLCIFYQRTSGRKFTVAQTLQHVQNLLDHHCAACGSDPTDPGNNVANGMLTANMVTNAKRRDLEAVKQKRAPGMVRKVRRAQVPAPAPISAPEPITKRELRDATSVLARALGINCRGSSNCGVGAFFHTPSAKLQDVRDAVAAGPEGIWSNGQQIACKSHFTGRLCAFYQGIGSRTFNKEQSVAYLDQLLEHKCDHCGSIPTDPGNDVTKGQLTVNFVA